MYLFDLQSNFFKHSGRQKSPFDPPNFLYRRSPKTTKRKNEKKEELGVRKPLSLKCPCLQERRKKERGTSHEFYLKDFFRDSLDDVVSGQPKKMGFYFSTYMTEEVSKGWREWRPPSERGHTNPVYRWTRDRESLLTPSTLRSSRPKNYSKSLKRFDWS